MVRVQYRIFVWKKNSASIYILIFSYTPEILIIHYFANVTSENF